MKLRKDGEDTRRRILQAAAAVFAQKGYHKSTNAEICGLCGANTALINYHFHNKESLYRLAWDFAREETRKRYPLQADEAQNLTSVEKLRFLIDALIRRNADSTCYDQQIWRKELAQPTGFLTERRYEMVSPIRQTLGKIIADILGSKTPDSTIRLCTMSIIAQCRVPIMPMSGDCPLLMSDVEHGCISGTERPDLSAPSCGNLSFINVPLETRIEHVYRFSLGGLLTLRETRNPSHQK